MTTNYNLDLSTENHRVHNTGDFNIAGHYEDNVVANLGLRITDAPAKAAARYDFTLFGPLVESADLIQTGVSRRSEQDIIDRVEDCRKVWKAEIVDKTAIVKETQKHWAPFQSQWDFNQQPELLNTAAPLLAVAGDKLFKGIFEAECDDGLKDIAKTLRRAFRSQECCLKVTSSTLFMPWGMLYTHPVSDEKLSVDGANWKKEGFWGYQHIVQQNPEVIKLKESICADGEVAILSVNFDDRLAESLRLPIIDEHIAKMSALAGKNGIKRTTKVELQTCFTDGRARLERILYFYCHGRGSEDGAGLDRPLLVLSDGTVSAADFQDWWNEQQLPISPLIFINACQGGQMQTKFYKSFAVELLRQGAVGLVGAQIDIPALFGIAYGERVFGSFFVKDKGRIRMGPLLRDINRLMWDRHYNPLGLVYSLYRGVDCFIEWPKNESEKTGGEVSIGKKVAANKIEMDQTIDGT